MCVYELTLWDHKRKGFPFLDINRTRNKYLEMVDFDNFDCCCCCQADDYYCSMVDSMTNCSDHLLNDYYFVGRCSGDTVFPLGKWVSMLLRCWMVVALEMYFWCYHRIAEEVYVYHHTDNLNCCSDDSCRCDFDWDLVVMAAPLALIVNEYRNSCMKSKWTFELFFYSFKLHLTLNLIIQRNEIAHLIDKVQWFKLSY